MIDLIMTSWTNFWLFGTLIFMFVVVVYYSLRTLGWLKKETSHFGTFEYLISIIIILGILSVLGF